MAIPHIHRLYVLFLEPRKPPKTPFWASGTPRNSVERPVGLAQAHQHAQDGRGRGDEAARPQAVRVLPRRAEWVWPAEGRRQDGAADGGCCAGCIV